VTGAPLACLMYHELEQPGTPMRLPDPGYVRYVVSRDRFATQMRRLREWGFDGVSVGDALSGKSMRKPIVVSFDDGCESDLVVAAPILRQEGIGATFYVSSALIGQAGYLSSSQLVSLAALGFEIGCHGATHRYLTELTDRDLVDETLGAKEVLEGLVGQPIEHFSCPGGRWDERVRRAVRSAGFRSMATSDAGMMRTDEEILRRNAVLRHTTDAEFGMLCSGRRSVSTRFREASLKGAKRVLGTATYERARDLFLRGK
jgi:peptidoglycan/xylan/chitin deacetylase (PgdA/CDA1 family)